MTDLELDRWIHEIILNECWCEPQYDELQRSDICIKCNVTITYLWGGSRNTINNYRYTKSLDAISRVELKVIDSTDYQTLVNVLEEVVGHTSFAEFATARQRAEACKIVWESK